VPIVYAPPVGTFLICDFRDTVAPEICKRRPVVLIAHNSRGLCTVIPCSTTEPLVIEPWHYLVHTKNPLPRPFNAPSFWIKGDLIFVASFDRLTIPFNGKDASGKRRLIVQGVTPDELDGIRRCIACAIFPGFNLDKQ